MLPLFYSVKKENPNSIKLLCLLYFQTSTWEKRRTKVQRVLGRGGKSRRARGEGYSKDNNGGDDDEDDDNGSNDDDSN